MTKDRGRRLDESFTPPVQGPTRSNPNDSFTPGELGDKTYVPGQGASPRVDPGTTDSGVTPAPAKKDEGEKA